MTDEVEHTHTDQRPGLTHAGVTGKVPLKMKPARKAGKPVKLSLDGKEKLRHLRKAGHISSKAAALAGIGSKAK